jgi:TolB-like protein
LLEDLDGVDPAFDMWLATERERVRDRARTVAETLLHDLIEPEAAIPAAQRLLQIDRTHEGAWRALMRAHAARGERGMAIEAYGRCRAVLADQLDAAPSQETEKLLTEIRGPAESRVPARPLFRRAPPRQIGAEPTRINEAQAPEVSFNRGAARVGVMPLRFVGSGEEEAHLAHGLAEEITTALARFRWMVVIAANSLARFATGTRDEAAIRQTFGIDLLLDGSVQRVQTRFRITMRLLDLRVSNQVVWAHRFDRQSEDLLSLQDDIAAEVVAQIDTQVLLIEAQRSATLPLHEASAYDMVLRTLPLIGRLQREQFMRAGEFLLHALDLDPDYAAAHAWLAWWQVLLLSQGWADAPAVVVEDADQHADRAVVLDPLDARCLVIAGHIRAFVQGRPRDARALHERALSLNPNLAMAWALSAMACACSGDLTEAERHFDRYKELSPHDPHAFFFDTGLVLTRLLQRDHEAAITLGRAVCQMNPAYSGAYKPYLAALGHLGRAREAADARRKLLSIEPGFSVEGFFATSPFERDEDRDHFAEGLRLAGVPIRLLLTQEA